ncbi:hypothetical protein [Mesorhizobium xinjiangense]|uniref:hypothetical protein n=1 Tax=Mesorhizobium xinjiangense TaxID=2678685 RepID=UPI0012EDAA3E|nr:hypothetical protein [Mesorhizobium xinjiangense]
MKELTRQIFEAAGWLREAASRLSIRHDKAPIDTLERVRHFARTRAALITQKKLYGYLKERMGTRYPKMFDDEVFVRSIDVAKFEVYAASLTDLTCFCIARATTGAVFSNDDRADLARSCYGLGIEENCAEAKPDRRDAWLKAFDERLAATVWVSATGTDERHFVESPKALIRWAPIADELKKYDREIVENSIRFAWLEVRTDYLGRLDADAVAADWSAAANPD